MSAVDVRVPASPAVPGGRTTVADALRVRWSWWRSRSQRARLHSRSLLTPVPSGALRLPGAAVDTVLAEAPDPYGRPCGLLFVRDTGHVSVAVAVTPPSPGDPAWVADLGAWLALLDREPELASGTAVLIPGTAPDRLQVLVQVTWRLDTFALSGDRAAAAVNVLARVPRLVHGLGQAAVGTGRPLTAAALATLVHDAYQGTGPATAQGARSATAQGARSATDWSAAGPAQAAQIWDRFQHGTAESQVWSLSRVPPSAVLAGVEALLDAAPRSGAARVTLAVRPTTGDAPEPAPAQLAALVTLTAPGGKGALPPVATVLDALPGPLRPWLRPCYGFQAAAFAAGLPTGILLAEHSAPPALLAGSYPAGDEKGRDR